jgi:hypothetical protein
MSSDYYTFKEGKLWKHYVPLKYDGAQWVDTSIELADNYNVFYGVDSYISSFTAVLNDAPGVVKNFKTLGYEGSQSKIDQFTTVSHTDSAGNVMTITDKEYYNLVDQKGWHVDSIITDLQEGTVNEKGSGLII